MKTRRVILISDGVKEWNFKVCWNDSKSIDWLKWPIFSVYRSGFQKSFWQPCVELHRQAYNDKVEQIYSRFDTDCKNESAIFTPYICFTGPVRPQKWSRRKSDPHKVTDWSTDSVLCKTYCVTVLYTWGYTPYW